MPNCWPAGRRASISSGATRSPICGAATCSIRRNCGRSSRGRAEPDRSRQRRRLSRSGAGDPRRARGRTGRSGFAQGRVSARGGAHHRGDRDDPPMPHRRRAAASGRCRDRARAARRSTGCSIWPEPFHRPRHGLPVSKRRARRGGIDPRAQTLDNDRVACTTASPIRGGSFCVCIEVVREPHERLRLGRRRVRPPTARASSPSPTRRAGSARPRPRSIWRPHWPPPVAASLVIDLDPQGNASTGLGIERDARRLTSYELILGEAELADAVAADRSSRPCRSSRPRRI